MNNNPDDFTAMIKIITYAILIILSYATVKVETHVFLSKN